MAGEQKTSHGWIIVAVLLVFAFFVFVDPSCFFKQPLVAPLVAPFGKWIGVLTELVRPTPTIQPDVPTITQDEACALVYNYLEARASSVTVVSTRLHLLTTLSESRPYFAATYQGKGKWQVAALGYGPKEQSNDWFFYYPGGLWNLYEALKTIEPANNQATALLIYIQRYTK